MDRLWGYLHEFIIAHVGQFLFLHAVDVQVPVARISLDLPFWLVKSIASEITSRNLGHGV